MNIRLHLLELEDQRWFPHIIRQGMLDFLRFMISKLKAYDEALPLLEELLLKTGNSHFTDLCAGAGGGIEVIQKDLSKRMGTPIHVTLTDLYPNIDAYRYLQEKTKGAIGFRQNPIDATSVPDTITGVRTIFSSFHHFRPAQARAILQDAADKGASIGVFEGASKSWLEMLLLWFVFPFAILLVTPFIRPFKPSRLFFTYIIPLIPLGIIWDGTVSLFRIYTPEMLEKLSADLNSPNYIWKAGKAGNRLGKHVIYLIGYPC